MTEAKPNRPIPNLAKPASSALAPATRMETNSRQATKT